MLTQENRNFRVGDLVKKGFFMSRPIGGNKQTTGIIVSISDTADEYYRVHWFGVPPKNTRRIYPGTDLELVLGVKE